MNVSIGKKWEQFVDARVRLGDFQTASEVLREGLRLLEKELLLKEISMGSLSELETKLRKTVEALGIGAGGGGEAALGGLRRRRKARGRNT